MALLDLLQALTQGGELWMTKVFTQAGDQLDLDFPGVLAGLYVRKNLFQHTRIEHQRLNVVAHRFEVDVLVDQLDGLSAKRMPEQFAVAAGRLHRLVDLRQPLVVGLVGAQARVR